jgi:SAM-dependent methyltransferase
MASVYDDFTAGDDLEGWLSDLLPHLERCGLSGSRLLDVGCGTGKSFTPMLARGWEVTGCDISPAMLERARGKAGGAARLEIADMCELPIFGIFDLVWSTDAMNYLLSDGELVAALLGMRDNLSSNGLLMFDLNAHFLFRTFFVGRHEVDRDGARIIWTGRAAPDAEAGSICEAALDIYGKGKTANTQLHRQRHFPEGEVLAALERTGLECLGVFGHGYDGVPRQPLDEEIHTKAIYIARKA